MTSMVVVIRLVLMLMLVIVTVAGGGGGLGLGLGSVDFAAAGNMNPGTIRSDRASSGLAARCPT